MMIRLKKTWSAFPVGSVLLSLFLFLFLPCLANSNTYSVHSEEREKWLMRAGLDLFPSLLAADTNITQKRGADGKLLLILAYVDDKQAATEMAHYLLTIQQIRNIPIRIELRPSASFVNNTDTLPAGIFLTQRLGSDLQAIINYGRKHHIIVFSPFEADVEHGVLGGIVVRERILPYINVKTMHSSDIEIKPFFLRIAKRYE
jgi:hypothetical protein